MSTSDPRGDADDFANVIDLTGANAAAAAGMPDPTELAKLAAEFYGALPTGGVPSAGWVPEVASLSAAPAMPVASAAPGMLVLPGMPATPAVPAMPAMPGTSLVPAFSFMNDAISIEDLAAGVAMPSVPLGNWGSTPSESQLRSAAAVTPAMPGVQSIPWMGGATGLPGVPALPASGVPDASRVGDFASLSAAPAMPVLPGMPATSAVPAMPAMPAMPGTSLVPAFSFMNDARSIEDLAAGAAMPSMPLGSWGSTPTESQLRSAAAVTPAMPGVQSIPWMGGATGLPGVPALLAGTLPSEASMVQAASPLIPGAVTPLSGAWSDPASFGFIELMRPLEAAGMAPVAGAIPAELGGFTASDLSSIPFDVKAIRRDFPILQESFNGRPLVWLDNAATTQKPQAVIDRLSHFYAHENSNVHRAAHQLAARATDAYEAARETVRRFLNASSTNEIVFVRGTTEGINLIAQSWGRRNIRKDDEIVITWLEHHANIVPWQMLCAEKGAKLRVAPVDDSGQVLLDEYERLLGPRTRLVSFSHVSNALGTVTPVREMIEMAHRHGATVVVDGAQSVAHTHIDVQWLDCDFFVFSGHKIFAPTGVGVVYGKGDILAHTPPWQGGGNMIKDVTFEKTIYNDPPVRFEAGTGTIADAVGLGAALDYVSRIGLVNIAAYEHDLLAYGTDVLRRIPGLRLIGTAPEKASVLSFVIDGYRTEDIGAVLAKEGIAVRAGHHCAQPILRRFGLESTVRPSLAFYNTCEEVDALGAALWNLKGGWLR
jgi:cysteine desulfurase/selenocysteine lyase